MFLTRLKRVVKGGMVNMEINCNGNYRIEHPAGSHDVWVYCGKARLMHITQSCEETEKELVRDVKEIIRILDL